MTILPVIIILLQGFESAAGLQFTQLSQGRTIKRMEGSSVNFTWTFIGDPITIEWGIKKDGENTFASNGKIFSLSKDGTAQINAAYKGRVSGTRSGNVQSAQVVFTLNNISISDMKSYLCILIRGFGQDSDQFADLELIVEVPPKITDISPNTTVNEGDSLTLTCLATGNPTANITWTKDNNFVDFPLDSIDKGGTGTYQCLANNGVGRPATAYVFVTVQYTATVKSARALRSTSWIGMRISLTCEANGVPAPNITWIKPDGKKIKKASALEHTANLLMKTDQDFGIYTCEATNGVGAGSTKTVQVHQIKKPDPPIVTVDIQATSIKVNWSQPAGDGGSPITAYRLLILHGDIEIRNETITDLSTQQIVVGGLTNSTNYTVRVFARNSVFEGNPAEKKIQTKFEGVPSAAEIVDFPAETKESEITLKWKEAEHNGAPITQYSVYRRTVREDGTSLEWKKIGEIKDPLSLEVVVKVEKGKEYEFVVTATNKFGEGGKEDEKIRKIQVLGDVPSVVVFTYEVKDDKITLNWEEPSNNGAAITLYTVYYGTFADEQWKEVKDIADVSTRKYGFKVKIGKKYKVLVTASNKYGESSKEGLIQQVDVPEGSKPSAQPKTSGIDTTVIAGAAAAGVLLIFGVIIFAIWWRRNKGSPADTSPSGTALHSDNPYELDDGYQDVSASAAARGLQAEAGPVAEPDYAQVDMSKKKRNRQPVTDEYAQVDKSKKAKKPRKQPGELDYAELDDFRPSAQPAAAAEAAPARPLIRRPAYEGTEYADITQFGVPQPEPTYGNISKKDVVYSNVQGI